jgi:ketosteroid isomerase-like protein
MRRVSIVLMLALAGMGVSGGKAAKRAETNSSDQTTKEVRKVEQDLQHAVLKSDTKTLDQALANEMIWLTSKGQFLTKSEVLAAIQSGNQGEFSFNSDDNQLNVYGQTVVVYRTTKGQVKDTDKTEPPTRTVTDVFVKQDGQWKLVAHGSTVVAQQ